MRALLLAAVCAGPAAAQDSGAGKALFAQHCAVCHQASGVGQDGLAPPLTAMPGRYAGTPAGRQLLARVGLFGMYGEIDSGGKRFNGNMPAFRALPDHELADILNYLVFDVSAATRGDDVAQYQAEEVAALRGQVMGGAEVRRQRSAVLEGAGK
ncbi:c-type cytochrome [Cupriavidus necator]|uniref:c-type cytochrome n=1 Tax=Cupriavidus necator TaxID=106590 RepID=UPI0019D058B3|nr:cytochrome c [Cupriavidus necator]